jgi:hypothetical protein
MTAAEPIPRGYCHHRVTTLVGGPLDGHTARIYPGQGGSDPKVITLGYGRLWPLWWWLDYTRQPDGTYHYQETT